MGMDGNGWQRMTSEMRQAQKIYGLRVTRTSPLEEKPMRDKANPPGTGTGPSRANPRMREEGTHRLLATRGEGRERRQGKNGRNEERKCGGLLCRWRWVKRFVGSLHIVAVENGLCCWFVLWDVAVWVGRRFLLLLCWGGGW